VRSAEPRSDARRSSPGAKEGTAQASRGRRVGRIGGTARTERRGSRRRGGVSVEAAGSVAGRVNGHRRPLPFSEGGGVTGTGQRRQGASVLYLFRRLPGRQHANKPGIEAARATGLFSKPEWQTGLACQTMARERACLCVIRRPRESLRDSNPIRAAVWSRGGHSVEAPSFAGIAAPVESYLVSKRARDSIERGNRDWGKSKPRLYGLAQTTRRPFHDITAGKKTSASDVYGRSRNAWGLFRVQGRRRVRSGYAWGRWTRTSGQGWYVSYHSSTAH